MNTEEKNKNLERVNFWITNCDNKVSYLLAIQGIVLTILFTSNYSICVYRTLSYKFSFKAIDWNSFLRFIEGALLYGFFVVILISLYNIYFTLKARLNPSIFQEPGLTTKSILFFDTIAQKKFQDFVSEQSILTQQEIDNDIDSQVFINSKICQTKFSHYNRALKFSMIAFLIGICYALAVVVN